MTAIAAIVEDGVVWMGGDSVGGNTTQYHNVIRKDPKVFINGEFLIGYTTSFRMGQLLRFELKLNPPKKVDCFQYLVCVFVPEIRKIFREHGYSKITSNEEKGGEFLVGFRGRLFNIFSDFQVGEVRTPYNAVGCAYHLLLGSLHTTAKYDISPKDRLELALAAAETFSAYVKKPFLFLSKGK